MKRLVLAAFCLSIAACDDDPPLSVMLGGGSGGVEMNSDASTGDIPAGDAPTSDTPIGDISAGDVPTGDMPTGDIPTSDTSTGGIPTGQAFNTTSSEFGWVDGPQNGGNGDPGTTGNWYTGAGGQYIGGQSSTGASLPAATEIAIYGSTAAAQNQPIQIDNLSTGQSVITTIVDVGPGHAAVARGIGVDLTYGTARALGFSVNRGGNVRVTPMKRSDFSQ